MPDAPKPGADAAKADEDDAEKPDLVLWHWKDGRLQSQQQVQEDRDKRFSYLATYRIADKKFIRLADETVREVTAPKKGRWAGGIDRRDYELTAALEGRNYQDLYAIDIQTGERKIAAKKVRWTYGRSPDGSKLLYFDDGHFHVFDIASGQPMNITKTAPVSFVNVEDDHNVVKPPITPEGWSADSKSVLLSDLWDVWQVPVAAARAPRPSISRATASATRSATTACSSMPTRKASTCRRRSISRRSASGRRRAASRASLPASLERKRSRGTMRATAVC